MAGSPPPPPFTAATAHSPISAGHFPPYSPSNKPIPFFSHEQMPPQTPPAFPQPAVARSPPFVASSNMPSPRPVANGHPHYPLDPPSNYQSANNSSPYPVHRTYSGPLNTAQSASTNGITPPSHAHPHSRQN